MFCFQGLQKGCIENEWVNSRKVREKHVLPYSQLPKSIGFDAVVDTIFVVAIVVAVVAFSVVGLEVVVVVIVVVFAAGLKAVVAIVVVLAVVSVVGLTVFVAVANVEVVEIIVDDFVVAASVNLVATFSSTSLVAVVSGASVTAGRGFSFSSTSFDSVVVENVVNAAPLIHSSIH